MAGWILGLDVGTSACKALAVDAAGQVLGHAEQSYPLNRPQPDWAEQTADAWWQAVIGATRELVRQTKLKPVELQAIGLTGQMHGTILLDAGGAVLRPAIIWADRRSQAQVLELTRRLSLSQIVAMTGNRPATGLTAASLLWVQNHEPHIWRSIAQILVPKDYIGWRLTGDFATDPSDASGTLLMDIKSRTWSQTMLDAVGLTSGQLPPIIPSQAERGRLSQNAADALGVPVGLPVVAGAGDTQAAALALGVTEPDTLACTIGTAAQLLWPTTTPITDPAGRVHTMCHSWPDRWHLLGAILSGGLALQWVASLWPEAGLETLLSEAANVPPGANKLLFLPYLQGERSPHFDPTAQGVFCGLTPNHSRAHLVRAVLEGVGFALRDSLEIFRQLGLPAIASVRLSGGAARSAVWSQILADIFGLSVIVNPNVHGSAYGAAWLVGRNLDWWETAPISDGQTYTPNPAQADFYNQLYTIYHDLYPALQPAFQSLHSL